MPVLDLHAEFAELCADVPAGDAGGAAYEETLGLAVQRLVCRTRGPQPDFSTHPVNGAGSPMLDCPFMMSVMALSATSLAQGLH